VKFDVLLPVTDVRASAKGSRMTSSKSSSHVTSVAPALPRVCEAVFVPELCMNVWLSYSVGLGLKILVARRQRGPTHNYKAII
jgi:hypothetical protein